MNPAEVVGILALVSVGMVLATAFLLKWAAFARTAMAAVVVLFLLVMMTGMLVGGALYYLAPGPNGLLEGLWVASALMSVSVVLVFVEFVREAQGAQLSGPAALPTPLRSGRGFLAAVIGFVLINELLMGWTFQRAAGGPVQLGGGGAGNLLVGILVSPWFVFPMALEMGLTLLWLLPALPPTMGRLLLLQPLLMLCSPPTLPGTVWVVGSTVGSSVVMAAAIGVLLVALYRGVAPERCELNYALQLYGSLGLMALGLGLWAFGDGVPLFSLSILAQMVIFLHAVTAPGHLRGDPAELHPQPARLDAHDQGPAPSP